MSIRVFWVDDRETIICYHFIGTWSWDDFYFATDEAHRLQASVNHRVDVIYDMHDSGRIPANAIGHLRNIANHRPGIAVFIPLQRFLVALLEALGHLSPAAKQRYRIAQTYEDALLLIYMDRASYALSAT